MNDSVMVTMNTKRLFEDLRSLLYEPFRAALLYREYEERYSDDPRVMVESISEVLFHDMPGLQEEVGKVIDEHVNENDEPELRSPRHNVYAPEMAKEMIREIGMEAWRTRHAGPIEAEFKIQRSTVSLHRIRHPDNFSRSMYG